MPISETFSVTAPSCLSSLAFLLLINGARMTDYLMLLSTLAIILLGAAVFTNGLEWFGKKLNLTDGAVGSIFAAVGTALPETLVPIVAIIFGSKEAGHAIGIGAIIGAPFM